MPTTTSAMMISSESSEVWKARSSSWRRSQTYHARSGATTYGATRQEHPTGAIAPCPRAAARWTSGGCGSKVPREHAERAVGREQADRLQDVASEARDPAAVERSTPTRVAARRSRPARRGREARRGARSPRVAAVPVPVVDRCARRRPSWVGARPRRGGCPFVPPCARARACREHPPAVGRTKRFAGNPSPNERTLGSRNRELWGSRSRATAPFTLTWLSPARACPSNSFRNASVGSNLDASRAWLSPPGSRSGGDGRRRRRGLSRRGSAPAGGHFGGFERRVLEHAVRLGRGETAATPSATWVERALRVVARTPFGVSPSAPRGRPVG